MAALWKGLVFVAGLLSEPTAIWSLCGRWFLNKKLKTYHVGQYYARMFQISSALSAFSCFFVF